MTMTMSTATSTGISYDWRVDAECTREDPELFFPVGNTGDALLQIEEAREVCKRCGVREECLSDATGYGIWGGLTEGERDSLKRRRRGEVKGLPRKFVNPKPSIDRLRHALNEGWTRNALRAATGVGYDQLVAIADGTVTRVLQSTAQKIADADLSHDAMIASGARQYART